MTIPFYTDLGDFSVIPNFQGEWDFRTVYIAGSLVSYNGRLYEAQTLVDQSQDAVQLRHDDFHRPDIADGWGTDADGNIWTVVPFSTGGMFSVEGNVGLIQGVSGNQSRFAWGDELGATNISILVKFSQSLDADCSLSFDFRLDLIDLTESERVSVDTFPTYSYSELHYIDYDIVLNGSSTFTNTNVSPFPLTGDSDYFCRLAAYGNTIMVKIWSAAVVEPDDYNARYISPIEPTHSGFAVSLYVSPTSATVTVKDISIDSVPDAPDVNTTDWLLIG